jgi:hypothetical protein
VVAGAGAVGQVQQAKAAQHSIDSQNQLQADEMKAAAGVELSDAAKRARQTQADSAMVERASRPTLVGAGIQIGAAGLSARQSYLRAIKKPPST